MKTYFTTTNYWRFTWDRMPFSREPRLTSIPTGLRYFRYLGTWRRSHAERRIREAAQRTIRAHQKELK